MHDASSPRSRKRMYSRNSKAPVFRPSIPLPYARRPARMPRSHRRQSGRTSHFGRLARSVPRAPHRRRGSERGRDHLQAAGLRQPEHEVHILNRLARRALDHVVNGRKQDDGAGPFVKLNRYIAVV